MSVDVERRPKIVERHLLAPVPGESADTHTVARSVGVYRRAVAAGSVVLDIEHADTLIAHAEEIAQKRVERAVFATIQNARSSEPSDRFDCLAQYYLYGGTDEASGEVGLEWGYTFGYDDDGTLLAMHEEDNVRKEAAARAKIIGDSHRLAEEPQFTPLEGLVVWDALEHAIRNGRTAYDAMEAAQLAGKMFGLGYEPLPGLPMVSAG